MQYYRVCSRVPSLETNRSLTDAATKRMDSTQRKTAKRVGALVSTIDELKDGNARLHNSIMCLLDEGVMLRKLALGQQGTFLRPTDSIAASRQTNLGITTIQSDQIEQLQHKADEQSQLIRRLTPTQPTRWPPPPLPSTAHGPQLQLPWFVHAPVMPAGPPWCPQPMVMVVPPMQQPVAPPLQQSQVYTLLDMADIDDADIAAIYDGRDGIPTRCRNRAEQVAGTAQFRNWVVDPASRELLVCGEHTLDGGQSAAALSLLCATLVRMLRQRAHHTGLVFFCGRHAEHDDEFAGANALIRSLIVQVLRYHVFDTARLPWEVDLRRVAAGDVRALCGLFGWLVRRLPREVTLVCLLDGIENYDCDEYEGDMLVVLECVLGLVREAELRPALKVMATSAATAGSWQELFGGGEECFLAIEGLPRVNQEACRMRSLDDDEFEEDGSGFGAESEDEVD